MTRTSEIPGFHDHLEEAYANGLTYMTYWRRCIEMGYAPEEAATIPRMEPRRGPTKGSITQRCLEAGVDRNRYYVIKGELDDTGVKEYTVQDIIEIAINRKRK